MKPLSVLLLLVAPASLVGQEVFDLKFKRDAGRGGTSHVEKRVTVKSRSKLIAISAKEVVEDNEQSRITVCKYRETILERPLSEKDPTRVRRVYETHQLRQGDQTTTLPLQGKTVLIEKLDDKHRFRFQDGTELSAREAEDLIDEFRNPAKPRLDLDELVTKEFLQVQHTYKINPKLLVKVFAPVVGPTMIEQNQPKGEYTLTRAYKKDGRQFGALDVRIHLPVQELFSFADKSPTKRLFLRPGAAMRIRLSTDGCIDGGVVDRTVTTNLSLDGTALVPTRDNPQFHSLLSLEVATEVTTQQVR